MTPHPNSNSSWCYFYMIFKVNHISTNSDSWVSYIITMLSQAPNTVYCSAVFMTFYNLFLIFIALLFIVFISSSCMPACTHLSIPKHSLSVHFRHTKIKGQGPAPRAVTLLCAHTTTGASTGLLNRWIWLLGTVSCASLKALSIFVGMGKNASGIPCTTHPVSHINSLKLNIKLSHL